MADVRSLLKNERANRRIAHPHARYSESGKLSCSLCDILVKPESAWKSHVRTPDHAKRALRAAEASAQQTSKKRKAESDDEDEEDPRKRARGEEEEDIEDEVEVPVQAAEQEETPRRTVRFAEGTKSPASPPPVTNATTTDDLDDDPEWLELQRLAQGESTSTLATPYAGATISAAPMTAEEVAAQAREDESTQKERREAELEDEKEDAAQALEAEFDEMDELEERVRKLREKREALRQGITANASEEGAMDVDVGPGKAGEEAATVELMNVDDEEDDEDDEEDDVWNFGAD